MAMMISKFHKLLQSKVLWVVILVVIALAFGVGGVVMNALESSSNEYEEAMAAGKLYGELVDRREYRQAYVFSYLALALAYGNIDISSEVDEYLQDSAWKRLVTLKHAEKLGLRSSDAEVVSAIRQHPGFQDQGRFNVMRYKAFAQQVLARMGISEQGFELYVREELRIQKVRRMVSQGILVSPLELQRTFHSISDLFTVDFVQLSRSNAMAEVEVTEAEARELFESDPEIYTLPEQIKIEYAVIDVTNYLADIEEIPEEDLLAFYNENLDTFVEPTVPTGATETVAAETGAVPDVVTGAVPDTVTGAVADAESAEETDDMDDFFSSMDDFSMPVTDVVQTVYLPFEEVREDIAEDLRIAEALELARDQAIGLVNRMVPDRDSLGEPFDDAMADAGLTVRETGYFSVLDGPDIENMPDDFTRLVFSLRDNPDEYFSDPIMGSNRVFLVALVERRDPRVPEFEEVQDLVMEDARERAVMEQLESEAETLISRSQELMAAGDVFTNVVRELGYDVETRADFSAASAAEAEENLENPYLVDRLVRAAIDRNPGEFAEPIPTETGMLVVYVREREAGDQAAFMSIRGQIIESIRSERMGRLFDDWQENLLDDAGFEPMGVAEAADEDAEETDVEDDAAVTNEAAAS